MEYKDYYKILGVAKDADEKAIKRAYRQLARQYHPDKNPGNDTAEEKFKEINEAYEVLGNSENRTKYDQLGSNYHRYQQMGGNPGDFDFSQWFNQTGQGGYQQANINFGDLFGNGNGGFSDFFSTIFGGAAGQTAYSQQDMFRRGSANSASTNLDTTQTVDITLEEAYTGTLRRFRRNGSEFTVKIPAGAKNGTKVRLRGKGNEGAYGTGDLFLVIEVKPHHLFKRAGNNLEVDVKVDVVTAVLGGKVQVPTLDGAVSLSIPAGTQGGQTIRLRGKGMPNLRDATKFGDLMAQIRIQTPTQLTEDERHLYEQLAELPQIYA